VVMLVCRSKRVQWKVHVLGESLSHIPCGRMVVAPSGVALPVVGVILGTAILLHDVSG
jgi:hypothetical protein